MHTKDLEANGDNALSYIAQVISGSALAKYMILAVALSALGSTLASLVSGVRVTFAMGSDGVLPRAFGRTDSRFKTPILATVIIGVIASIGVWLYTFGSGSVQDSFTTVVSVDGLLFAVYYALTGIATAVYFRKLAVTGPWAIVQLAVFPLAAAGFLAYIIVRSVEGLGGWSGRDLVSLYVMLGIGVAIMLYVRFTGGSDYFSLPRETYQPEAEPVAAAAAAATRRRPDLIREARGVASLRSSHLCQATVRLRGSRPCSWTLPSPAASKPAGYGAGQVSRKRPTPPRWGWPPLLRLGLAALASGRTAHLRRARPDGHPGKAHAVGARRLGPRAPMAHPVRVRIRPGAPIRTRQLRQACPLRWPRPGPR